ncbi:ATP-dependent DNA helicase [Nocardioides pakistanensis]
MTTAPAPSTAADDDLLPSERPSAASEPSMHQTAQQVLRECVTAITGDPALPPREGQEMLMADIVKAMGVTHRSGGADGGQLTGEAPTGVGKSFSYLVPAAVAAALHEERTVVSTEMISLQTQIIDKDAPVVVDAVRKVTGKDVEVALLKGWSNYVCAHAAVETAQALVDPTGSAGSGLSGVKALAKKIAARLEASGPVGVPRRADGKLDFAAMLDSDRLAPEERAKYELVSWALEQTLAAAGGDDSADGDKNAYTGTVDNMLWESVSVSSADCIGEKCPLFDYCAPRRARAKAADADIVVTNHHLLAVQAAKAAPVVIGNRNMGRFDHIFVDEAHGLPSIVRNQGSVQVSERAIKAAVKAITWVLDETDPKVAELIRDGDAVAMRVGMELEDWARRIKRNEDVLRMSPEDDPVAETALLITGWTKRAADMVTKATDRTANHTLHMKAKRVKNRLDGLNESVKLVSVHESGAARWVEVIEPYKKANDQTPYPVAQYTPVDVSRALERTLWTTDDLEAMAEQAEVAGVDPDAAPPRRALTAVALSATLPKGFGRQAGLITPLKKYPSPFDTAYGNSVLYVPRAVDALDVEALRRDYPGKPKFDTGKHAEWAAGHILDLVEANGGSALVLAATAGAGKKYTEALKAAAKGRWAVASQWDGKSLKGLVDDWKADASSVLVGTKSLMTGVDAAGETCTLVIVDRPARSRSNPVDDARVEALIENVEMDKWDADRLVYVSDAALLLEQAAGRLIRRVTDSGMVAVLDPRLLKVGPFPYQARTRNEYLETLFRFEKKISDPAKATAWLRAHRAALAGQKAS